jgi:hypothetical protein
MTALQDRLSFRPADPSTILDMFIRPLRVVLGGPDVDERTAVKIMTPGVERC